MDRKTLTIRPSRCPAEIYDTLERIEAVYMSHRDHKSKRLARKPDVLLVAERGGEIVGASGLFLLDDDDALASTEKLFGLDLRDRVPRRELLEVGRVVSLSHDPRFFAAMMVAIRQAGAIEGRHYALACAKPRLLNRLARLDRPDLVTVEHLDACVQPSLTPQDCRGFFIEGEPPVVFLMTAPAPGDGALPPAWGVSISLGPGPLPRVEDRWFDDSAPARVS
ncbi:MAG: hypothetical protein AAF628_01500 [Planctomycetota bacterium]